MSIRLLPYGERAVLIEVDPAVSPLALVAAANQTDGVVEVVPAACTLLVRFDPRVITAEEIGAAIESRANAAPGVVPRDPVELVVRYDGPDLTAVAHEVGVSVEELVGRHTAARYTVAFCGFAPGFAYLTGLDPVLHVARLDEPRTAVPAGSVGVAGEFTGAYPRSSPGGWRLLGRTDAPLWDAARRPPALLSPGMPVRFRPA